MTTGTACPRPAPTRRSLWLPWAVNWCGVLALAVVNGAVHRGYQRPLGELRAEQLSNLVLLLLVGPWVRRVDARHPTRTAREALQAGLLWATLTVAFEFGFGRYVNGDSWATLLGAYDLPEGHLWPVAVVGIAAAPTAARRWRVAHDR